MSHVVTPHPASFRDPAGFVFRRDGKLLRQINRAGVEDYQLLSSSGLADELLGKKLLIDAPAADLTLRLSDEGQAVIAPRELPTITYPWEWSFSALKAAALLTLDIQRRAVQRGMTLKDATPLNVQFEGVAPLFIDTLSFTRLTPGQPWRAYRQFCEEFLAPILIMRYFGGAAQPMLRGIRRGIAMPLLRKLLPRRSLLVPSIFAHVHLHGLAQERHTRSSFTDATASTRVRPMSTYALEALIDSLSGVIHHSNLPEGRSIWSEYYTETNYSDPAFQHKREIIGRFLSEIHPASLVDLGANVGAFSEIAAEAGARVIASDFDALCVEGFFQRLTKRAGSTISPVVLDVLDPTPPAGVNLQEFRPAPERFRSEAVLALALIHHLALTGGVPLDRLAAVLQAYGPTLIIEFVPAEDSQAQRLLVDRGREFPEYTQSNFEAAFGPTFEIIRREPIRDTGRTLYLMRRR